MENQKQKKSAGTVVLVVLLLIVTIAALILATYAWARYTTVETGGATAQVAKWDVTFTENSNGIFRGTYNHVVKERLAPGMTGSFDLSVKSVNTETDYDYRMAITHVNNKPTNLHFYSDAACTNEITNDAGSFIYGHVAISGKGGNGAGGTATTSHTEKVDGSDVTVDSITKTIYWKWEYQTANITKLPDDVDDEVTITPAEGGNQAVTTTKRKRIVHDLNVLLVQKGVIDSETSANALPETAEIADMKAKKGDGSKVTEEEIMQVINDAIDTVDGIRAATMSLDVELTAIQCDPSTGATEFTQYITPHDYQTDTPKATPSGVNKVN